MKTELSVLDRRGQLGGLEGLVTTVVIVIVVAGIGLYVLVTMNSTGTLNTSSDVVEVFRKGVVAIDDIIDWIPLIVIAIIGGFVITLFLRRRTA